MARINKRFKVAFEAMQNSRIALEDLTPDSSPGPLPPELTLDDSSGLADYAATFTQGGSAVALADVDTIITDPSADGIDTLTVVGSSISDGADEIVAIGADSFPLNADQSTTEVVGATTFAIAFVTSTKTFTVTKSGGGAMPVADLQSFIEAMTYENTSGAPTTGDRTFTFQVTDGGQSSNSAVSTITVAASVTAPSLTAPSVQYVNRSQTINTISTANAGDNGTWSVTSGTLPTGLSLNTSTGDITGTVDAGATVEVVTLELTCTNGAGSDTATFDIEVLDTTVTLIDSGDTFPYEITSPGLYVLTEDVQADGTLFSVAVAGAGNGVYIDGAGYTGTYDNATPITIPNFSFENGTGTDADDWDFTNAPNAERYAGVYLDNTVSDGSYSLRWADPTDTEYVESDGTITLETGVLYTLSAMFWYDGAETNPGFKIYAQLVGTGAEPTIETFWAQTNNRGIQYMQEEFTAPAGTPNYKVRIGIDPSGIPTWSSGVEVSSNDGCVYLGNYYVARSSGTTGGTPPTHTSGEVSDGGVDWEYVVPGALIADEVRVQRTLVYGIAIGTPSFASSTFPGLTQFGGATGCKVTQLGLTQGSDGASWSPAIQVHGSDNVEVHGCNLTVNGADSHVVRLRSQDGFVLNNCDLTSNATTTSSRDNGYSHVVGGPEPRGTFTNNRIHNGPHGGIQVVGTSTIANNVIRLKAERYSNNFAIYAGGDNTEVYGNQVLCGSGEYSARGIIVFSGGPGFTGQSIHDNVVEVQCIPQNQEYGGEPLGGAYALQTENNATNVEVYDNTFTVDATQAHGYPCRLKEIGTGVYLHGNTWALNAGDDYSSSAAVQIDVTDAADITIEDETYVTNAGIVGNAANATAVFDACTVTVNTLAAGAVAFTSETAGNVEIIFRDPVFTDSASRDYFEGGDFDDWALGTPVGTAAYGIEWTQTITLTTDGVTPASGVAWTLDDSEGTEIATGTTDGTGQFIEVCREYLHTGDSRQTYNGHEITTDHPSVHRWDADAVKSVTFDVNVAIPALADPATQNLVKGDTGVSIYVSNTGGDGTLSTVSGSLPNSLSAAYSAANDRLEITGNVDDDPGVVGSYSPVYRVTNSSGYDDVTVAIEVAAVGSPPDVREFNSAYTNSGASVDVTTPGVAGDLLLAIVQSSVYNADAPTGWTKVVEWDSGGFAAFGTLLQRNVAHQGGSEPATVTITTLGSNVITALVLAVQDADVSVPVVYDVVPNWTGNNKTLVFDQPTIAENSSLVIRALVSRQDTTADSMTAGNTEITQVADGVDLLAAWKQTENAGTAAAATATVVSGGGLSGIVIVIPPA